MNPEPRTYRDLLVRWVTVGPSLMRIVSEGFIAFILYFFCRPLRTVHKACSVAFCFCSTSARCNASGVVVCMQHHAAHANLISPERGRIDLWTAWRDSWRLNRTMDKSATHRSACKHFSRLTHAFGRIKGNALHFVRLTRLARLTRLWIRKASQRRETQRVPTNTPQPQTITLWMEEIWRHPASVGNYYGNFETV